MNPTQATILVPIIAILAGCAAPQGAQPVPRKTQFDESEYERYRKPGTGSISGQVFMRTRGGDVKLGAGVGVTLNPATSHGMEWMEIFASNRVPAPGDPRAEEFRRVTQCDGSGNFEFSNLPAGSYCLVSGLAWETGAGQTGGVVFSIVQVEDGKTAKVMLTK